MASLFYIGERQISESARDAWTSEGLTVYSFHPHGIDEATALCRGGDLFLLEAGAIDIYSTLETLSDDECPASVIVRGAGAMAKNSPWSPLPLLFVDSSLSDIKIAQGALGWLRRRAVKKFIGLADVLSMAASLNLTIAIHFTKRNNAVASITMVEGKVMSASTDMHDKLFALRWIDKQDRLSFRISNYVHRDGGEALDWKSILTSHLNVEDLTIRMLGENRGMLGAQVGVASLDQPDTKNPFASGATGKYDIIWKQKNVSAEWVSSEHTPGSSEKQRRFPFSTGEYRTVG